MQSTSCVGSVRRAGAGSMQSTSCVGSVRRAGAGSMQSTSCIRSVRRAGAGSLQSTSCVRSVRRAGAGNMQSSEQGQGCSVFYKLFYSRSIDVVYKVYELELARAADTWRAWPTEPCQKYRMSAMSRIWPMVKVPRKGSGEA